MRPEELSAVRAYSGSAATEELLDRVTAYRSDQDAVALELFERELRSRGIGHDEIVARRDELSQTVVTRADGSAVACTFCERPAEAETWAWFRLWGKVPLFPRPVAVCPAHRSQSGSGRESG